MRRFIFDGEDKFEPGDSGLESLTVADALKELKALIDEAGGGGVEPEELFIETTINGDAFKFGLSKVGNIVTMTIFPFSITGGGDTKTLAAIPEGWRPNGGDFADDTFYPAWPIYLFRSSNGSVNTGSIWLDSNDWTVNLALNVGGGGGLPSGSEISNELGTSISWSTALMVPSVE